VIFETDLGLWYLNSIVTSAGVTLGVILISAMCGYAISQIRFRGRRALWFLILASFMIPVQALIVGHFFLMYNFGLINTWLGVILPQLIAPVAVIVYKQFFDSVPRELREAAMLDGASHAQILFRIYLPTNWGVTAALAIITFIGAWNAFLWPFLAVTTEPMMNVAVAMGANFTALGENYLAASLLAGLPVALVYLLFQRRVTQAVVLSSGVTSK
jgi:multiple sugar transport system permease protein